ncbi:hypothetical protein ACH5RR_007623 [Cinchona calisaya]|uniref:Mediator-associated protein 2 n=1 Tax=Cinchona calisaya TaxID=153742 RepID=A0ABD3A913_9GENT
MEESRYKPPEEEFEEVKKDPLIDLNLTDSNELWLIQWPINQAPDFNGQQVSLKLHHDGHLGSFEGSSGKSYEVVSFKSQEPEATVFLSSASESKIAGKISRRVSLVHYPEPSELKPSGLDIKQMAQRSATSLTNSAHHHTTSKQGTRSRNKGAVSGYTSSVRTTINRSSGLNDLSKTPLKRHVEEPSRSIDQSLQESGKEHSAVTSSGALEHSKQKKKKIK